MPQTQANKETILLYTTTQQKPKCVKILVQSFHHNTDIDLQIFVTMDTEILEDENMHTL
jgi:hypothetical protein